MTQSQRAAVAVEQANILTHGGDRTKDNFKVSNDTLNDIAEKESFKGKNLSLNEVADANVYSRMRE